MDILFNQTIQQCRLSGARGGRAFARNLRLRRLQAPVPPAVSTFWSWNGSPSGVLYSYAIAVEGVPEEPNSKGQSPSCS